VDPHAAADQSEHFLIAEDHSGWAAVTRSADQGGLGFDATWFAEYYHHLIGDAQNDPSRARLLKMAGFGDSRPLNITGFAGSLVYAATGGKVVYHESHDEAGNSSYEEGGQRVHSARTIAVAVNDAPLIGETRRYAETRLHFAAGVTLLAPAIPMFFMGEEVGASLPYLFDSFASAREDFHVLRQRTGENLFRCYQNLIRLRRSHSALRSRNIDILHVHDANRMLAFRRWDGSEDLIVVASLSNISFANGYRVQHARIATGGGRSCSTAMRPAMAAAGSPTRIWRPPAVLSRPSFPPTAYSFSSGNDRRGRRWMDWIVEQNPGQGLCRCFRFDQHLLVTYWMVRAMPKLPELPTRLRSKVFPSGDNKRRDTSRASGVLSACNLHGEWMCNRAWVVSRHASSSAEDSDGGAAGVGRLLRACTGSPFGRLEPPHC
jgi:hypothetical protein